MTDATVRRLQALEERYAAAVDFPVEDPAEPAAAEDGPDTPSDSTHDTVAA